MPTQTEIWAEWVKWKGIRSSSESMAFSKGDSEVISELNNCTDRRNFLCYILLFLGKGGVSNPEMGLVSPHLIQWITQLRLSRCSTFRQ